MGLRCEDGHWDMCVLASEWGNLERVSRTLFERHDAVYGVRYILCPGEKAFVMDERVCVLIVVFEEVSCSSM